MRALLTGAGSQAGGHVNRSRAACGAVPGDRGNCCTGALGAGAATWRTRRRVLPLCIWQAARLVDRSQAAQGIRICLRGQLPAATFLPGELPRLPPSLAVPPCGLPGAPPVQNPPKERRLS